MLFSFSCQQTQNLPPIQRGSAEGDFTPSEGVVISRLRRPGVPPSGGGDKRGQGHHMVPLPPLDSPKTLLCAATPFGRAAKREKRGLGSVRRADFGTLLCPEFTLRDLPRITVRGQTVQSGSVLLRKAPLRSRMCPWSTRRPCGPLAFRRATEGSRVRGKMWGCQEGDKKPGGCLGPLLPPPPGGGKGTRPPRA